MVPDYGFSHKRKFLEEVLPEHMLSEQSVCPEVCFKFIMHVYYLWNQLELHFISLSLGQGNILKYEVG